MRTFIPMTADWILPTRHLTSAGMVRAGGLVDDFDRIVDHFIRPVQNRYLASSSDYEIVESNTHYLVTFDMPGVKKEHIKIELNGNDLVVSGHRNSPALESGEAGVAHLERSSRTFERSFKLPASIQFEKIEAHYEDGVLSLILPKPEVAKGRTIEIQSGDSGLLSRFFKKNDGEAS